MSMSTDLLIIGGGPAGLSCGTMFARTLRPAMLYDSGAYRNASAGESHTIPGYDGADPASFRARLRSDLAKYTNVEVRDGKIVELRRIAGGAIDDATPTMFEAVDERGRVVRARKVVLATGVRDVLPPIPGLAEQWGKRAIHCLFCHGTETAGSRMGFLLSRSAATNAAVVGGMLTMWGAVPHAKRYILTNGVEVEGDDDPAGVGRFLGVIEAKGYEIITSPITEIRPTPEGMTLILRDTTLDLAYLMLAPDSIEPAADAKPLLTPALLSHYDIGAMGALPGAPPDAHPAHMPPRAGADPRTPLRGLFWAGNSGSAHANVSMSCAQGQIAGVVAADEVSGEDLAVDMKGV